jgi:hypothetical protein
MLISVKKVLGDVKITIENENRYSFRVSIEGEKRFFLL